ncbi:MAG: biotin/lipoyl-binding protein, partial [Bdellovibrionales bacterium]|nr:biotin/lipoyl-binding protein [Bdellovibrionales bacterium]
NNIVSPMPGKILQIKVSEGDKVTKDQTLIIMEAMKMELTLKANSEGNVEKVSVKENDIVSAGTVLIELV